MVTSKVKTNEKEKVNCGLVMPLAPMTGYRDTHFFDVQSILIEAINKIEDDTYKFNTRMVSDSKGEIDIIHNSIVNNIYEDPIIICDISGRNGNVMLELGLRLAFDKPVVIIKDDKTDYMFDISMIEHVNYPSDLRHTEIIKFKELLQKKVLNTLKKSREDSSYSPFLKNFKHIKVKTIGEETINSDEMLNRMDGKLDMMSKRLQMFDALERDLMRITQPIRPSAKNNLFDKNINETRVYHDDESGKFIFLFDEDDIKKNEKETE